MKNRLLIAVDETDASQRAVRYVGHLSNMIQDMEGVLLHVRPAVNPCAEEATRQDALAHKELRHFKTLQTNASKTLLEQCREELAEMGVDVEQIETVSRQPTAGVAKTILDFGHEKRHTAIVVGRRRLSPLKKPFLGSVSADLVEHSTSLPIWIVGNRPPNQRFLVPVDGSESALRAVDHLSQVFRGHADVAFHLFHVVPRLVQSCPIDFGPELKRLQRVGRRGVHHCIDNFCAKALHCFKTAGLREDQIQIKIAERLAHPGKGILSEINRGDYRTVAIGRRGMSRSYFTGSVSRFLIGKSAHITLWLVP